MRANENVFLYSLISPPFIKRQTPYSAMTFDVEKTSELQASRSLEEGYMSRRLNQEKRLHETPILSQEAPKNKGGRRKEQTLTNWSSDSFEKRTNESQNAMRQILFSTEESNALRANLTTPPEIKIARVSWRRRYYVIKRRACKSSKRFGSKNERSWRRTGTKVLFQLLEQESPFAVEPLLDRVSR